MTCPEYLLKMHTEKKNVTKASVNQKLDLNIVLEFLCQCFRPIKSAILFWDK